MSIVVVASVVACVVFILNDSPMQSICGSVVPVFSTLALVWHRRTGALRGPIRLAMVSATVGLSASALAQTPIQPTNIAFLSVLPLIAMLLLDREEAKRWMAGLLALGLILFWAGSQGYSLPIRDPNPAGSEALTYALLILVVWGFAQAYDQLTSMAVTELEQTSRAKNAFLANVSHEIRTPMNGVLGLTDALLVEPMSDDQRASLRLIRQSGEQLITLINDLLDATKAEAGKLDVAPHDFDLWSLLADVRGLFEPIANTKGVCFELNHAATLPRFIHQDSIRLRQVLSNLISNALKFTDQGSVALKAEAVTKTRVCFSVSDTGVGISSELATRLFKPFEQAEGSAKRRHGGTGLGLALSQQLVTLMGGRIVLESQPGEGARFSFSLECLPATTTLNQQVLTAPLAPARVPTFEPLGSHSAGPREMVLIVDDNAINLTVACKLVEKAGFLPIQASSGAAALRILENQSVSLVLMDCHMPELDGFETTKRIRQLSNQVAHVPVVALTASTLADDVAACRSSGMNDVLYKPISLESLAAILNRFAGRCRR